MDDFKETILGFRFGRTGYSFVIDNQGRAIIHPQLEGVNVLADESLPNESVEKMLKLKKGKIIYPWNNPGESFPREKLVIFNYIPEYEWIVASSSYLDEFLPAPVHHQNPDVHHRRGGLFSYSGLHL